MNLILSHETAFELWHSDLSRLRPEFGLPSCESTSSLDSGGMRSVWQHLDANMSLKRLYEHLGGLREPLHVLVTDSGSRIQSKFAVSHVWSERPLPAGSVLQLGEGLCVVSPELCYVQMAQRYSGLELAWIGSVLCSSYCLNCYDRGDVLERAPITSVGEIGEFLRHVQRRKGVRNAARALRLISERTRSPREATLATLLTAPSRMGGQQLPPFEINAQYDFQAEGGLLTDRRYFELDMYWEEEGLCLEYNGKPHESYDAALRDLEKVTSLRAEGITVIPVNKRQFDSYEKLEVIVGAVRKALNTRDRTSDEVRMQRRLAHANLIRFERSWCDRARLHDYAWWRIVESMADAVPNG